MYATDDLGDALAATRAFLLPFDVHRWLRVAFVTFFLGGAGMQFSSHSVATGGGGGSQVAGPPPEGATLAVAGVVVAVLVVALAFAAVRGVMDLVLLEMLREEELALRRFWSLRWRQGLWLFAFRLAITVTALTLVALPVGLVALGVERDGTALVVLGVVLLVPVLLVVPVGAALAKGFTTSFVGPTMLLEGAGPVAGWRRFWPTLTADPREFLGYAVVQFGVWLASGIGLTAATTVGALALAVPALPLVWLGRLLQGVSGAAGTGLLALTVVLYGVGVVVVAAFAKAPFVVFMRYFAVLVLGDVDPDLDLVPLTREAVRAVEE